MKRRVALGGVPRRSGIVDVRAGCHDCDWSPNGHWRLGTLQAGAHAKRTGHNVWAEQYISIEWNPRPEQGAS